MSMLNAHTASNGALMMTACVERNGWSHPNQQRLRTASPLTVMMPGTKPKPQPLQLGSTDWRSLRVATLRGFESPDKNSLCDKLSPSDPIPTANRAGHSEWQFLPLVS